VFKPHLPFFLSLFPQHRLLAWA